MANQLILPSKFEREEQERKRAAEEGKEKRQSVDFAKLDMLQGGIERRFIPELSEPSKQLIGSFFKITMDEELSQLATEKPELVQLSEEDEMLQRVCVKSESKKEYKAMDGNDYLEHTITLLQH